MRLITLSLVFAGWFLLLELPVNAEDGVLNTIGLRAGIGDHRNNEEFSQYEVYGNYSLPWRWVSANRWTIGSLFGFNAGYVTCEGDAFVGSIGLGLYLMTPGQHGVVSVGLYPTYLERSVFGGDDFGATFQFTSALGLIYNFSEFISVGYRWQHMSNAGISDENPGLNINMIEIGYRF